MNFNLFLPVKIISGSGAVRANASELKQLGESCLIITGKSSAKKCGALDDVTAALKEEGIDYSIYDKVGQNPLLSTCFEAGKIARDNKLDFIIAIGGGSPLDCAKAAAIFAANPQIENPADIYAVSYDKPLPLAVVGTTAGTGSEVSPTAVITVDETGMKRSITSPLCYPTTAFCDPKYTYNINREITVSCALDAFAHAIEGWFSRKRDTIVEIFAKAAMPAVWQALKALSEGEALNEKQRDELYYGSVYSGVILKIGTLFPHGLGYALTEDYGVPHGQACAVFDIVFLRWNRQYAPELTEEFLNIIGADFDEVEKVYNSLIDLPEIKMSDDEIEKYSARWSDDNGKLTGCFGEFKQQNVTETLKELFGE